MLHKKYEDMATMMTSKIGLTIRSYTHTYIHTYIHKEDMATMASHINLVITWYIHTYIHTEYMATTTSHINLIITSYMDAYRKHGYPY